MNDITLVVPTLFGLEAPAAEELRRLDLQDVHAENGRVLAKGTLADVARANINLRTGERVQIALGAFTATTFDELFEQTKALPWEEFIPRDGAFPVKGFTLNSQLSSEPACQSIIKKAIASRLGAAYGLETLPEDGALYQVQFSLLKDQATLLLDTSGDGLHKRGYRADSVLAPLRETLAAAMVLFSHYHGQALFYDPFCGSGTIAIEAALIARNRAPGLDRRYSAQKWPVIPASCWSDAVDEAMDKEYHGKYTIWGSDIDPHAVRLAEANAAKAEVDDIIRFSIRDARKLRVNDEKGFIVCNPPYGERLMELKEAEELYKSFGRACAELSPQWTLGILTPSEQFEQLFGRRCDRKRKLYNGKIKCNLHLYEGKRPTAKAKKPKKDENTVTVIDKHGNAKKYYKSVPKAKSQPPKGK